MDQGRTRSPVRAVLEHDGEQMIVRVGPLPKGSLPTSGSWTHAGKERAIAWGPPTILPSGMIELRGFAPMLAAKPPAQAEGEQTVTMLAGAAGGRSATASIPLPGYNDRTAAFDARVTQGQWDSVQVMLQGPLLGGGLFSDETLAADFERSGNVTYRILVPRAADAQAGSPTEKRQ